jgi:uncharacterized membrane protein
MIQQSFGIRLIRALIAPVLAVVLLVTGIMFSVVVVLVVAMIGISAGLYFLWKTRHLRRAMREHVASSADPGQVIEGEFTSDCIVEVVPEKPVEACSPRLPSP